MTQIQTPAGSNAEPGPAGELPPPASMIPPGAMEAILAAAHGDAFSVLGPHEVASGVWDIRVMHPGAEKIDLIDFYDLERIGTLELIHPDGFYAGRLTSPHRPGYRLGIHDVSGETIVNDPYLFGPSLSATGRRSSSKRTAFVAEDPISTPRIMVSKPHGAGFSPKS